VTRQDLGREDAPRESLSEGRLLVLWGLGCAAIIVALFVLLSNPDVRSAIWKPGLESKFSSGFDARNDPPLNAVFAPRYLLFEGGLRIAAMQTDVDKIPSFVQVKR